MKNILKNKMYLYLTEFFSGMSVMAVELAASRLMAPYFSSSQVIYTIIIGTVMIAMALGNIYGGKSADKNPDPAILYRRMLISAAWIAAIPILGRFIILGVSGVLVLTVSTNFLAIAAFISCMLIFVFPLFLLGTVTPSLVRYIMENTEESGEIVGRLGAFNTIGSIIGTFLPTFVTIPAVGTTITFIMFSGVLVVLSVLYFISAKKISKTLIITVIIFILCCIFGSKTSFAFWEDNLNYEGESVYNYLQVKEEDDRVILSTNVLFGVQSLKMKNDELTGMYYDYALAAVSMAEADESADGELDVLILGNGTGTFATQCDRYFDVDVIDAVEIDGKITELATEYFDMSEKVNVYEYDGRAFLQAAKEKYDVILVDAYQDITIPFQMSSQEFFQLVKDHLTENGIMVVNMNMHSDGNGSINEYLADTILQVFPDVWTVDVPWTTNRELFASANADCDKLLKAWVEDMKAFIKDAYHEDADLVRLKSQMELVSMHLEQYTGTGNDYLLTDDKAPVEVLGMSMIDSLITDELSYYKDIYKEGGLSGLLESLQ